MRNKHIRLWAVALVVALAALPALAQEGQGERNFNFDIKAGYFMPTGSEFSDIYGGGLVFGGNVIVWVWEEIGFGGGMDYFSSSGVSPFVEGVQSNEASLTIIPITFNAYYRPKVEDNQEFSFYLGGGGGYYHVSEELTVVDLWGQTHTASASQGAFGFQAFAGVHFYKYFIAEVKFSIASVGSEAWDSVDVGGISIMGGARF